MRGVLQRVRQARVLVDGTVIAAIGEGLLLLLGVANDDQPTDAERLIDKILNLRIFSNDSGKFDRSLLETGGQLLVVSQFTLFADTRKGRRPAFTAAARPEHAIPLYEHLVARSRAAGIDTATGRFGAHMQVELSNDGPVTILIDSRTS